MIISDIWMRTVGFTLALIYSLKLSWIIPKNCQKNFLKIAAFAVKVLLLGVTGHFGELYIKEVKSWPDCSQLVTERLIEFYWTNFSQNC